MEGGKEGEEREEREGWRRVSKKHTVYLHVDKHVTRVVRFNNFALTMGFYWS